MELMAGDRSILVSSMELTESCTEKAQYLRPFQTPISYVSYDYNHYLCIIVPFVCNAGDKYTSFSLGSLYATFALSAAAMILCVIIAPLLFLNSYQTVTTWWKGPPILYLLSFITGKAINNRFSFCMTACYRNLILFLSSSNFCACIYSCSRNGGSGNIFGLLPLGSELRRDFY